MDKRKIAHTGLEVSRVCMGTMTFGSQADLDESARLVDRCLDAGVNFFDTANIYNQGLSEEMLGRILGARRKDIVLASKVRGAMGKPPEYVGLSREAIRKGIEASLRRLNTDYLDIYYLHQPDYDTPIEDTLDAMEELRREGKIRYPATSNYSAGNSAKCMGYAKSGVTRSPGLRNPCITWRRGVSSRNICPLPKKWESVMSATTRWVAGC